MDEGKEVDRIIRPFDPHRAAFFRALINVEGLSQLPEEDEIAEWEENHPDEAQRMGNAIDHIISEFSMSVGDVARKDSDQTLELPEQE